MLVLLLIAAYATTYFALRAAHVLVLTSSVWNIEKYGVEHLVTGHSKAVNALFVPLRAIEGFARNGRRFNLDAALQASASFQELLRHAPKPRASLWCVRGSWVELYIGEDREDFTGRYANLRFDRDGRVEREFLTEDGELEWRTDRLDELHPSAEMLDAHSSAAAPETISVSSVVMRA